MVSKLSCFLLFAITALTYGRIDFYKVRSLGLIEKLSGLKKKHGLNFANIEGIKSLPKNYKKQHPNWHVLEKQQAQVNPNNIFNEEKFHLLTEKSKQMLVARTRDEDDDETIDETNEIIESESLRMHRKKPKDYQCKKKCSPYRKPSLYLRSGDANRQDKADDTVDLLNDLENLLAGNGIYRIFLGCLGNKCGGTSHAGGYIRDRDNTDEREYLGRTDRDDDDDTGVRRY